MPQIPQYVSKESLNTQPNKQINVESFVESAGGNNMVKAGKQLEDVGDKLIQIQNANDESNANIERLKFEDTYSKQIDSNPDTATALKNIENDTRKNREETAKMIHDPIYRQKWTQKQELSDQVYIINQKAKIGKRIVSEGTVNLYRDLELDKSNYRNAQTEEEKNLATQSIHNKIYDPKRTALFKDEEEKYKLENDTIKQAQDDLKDVESLKRVKEKELRIAQEVAVNARENEYIKMKVTGVDKLGGQISREDLIIMAKQDMKRGDISPKFTDLYVNALKSPKAVKAKSKSVSFGNIMSDINKGTKSHDKIRNNILQDRSDGFLSSEDEASLSAYMDMMNVSNPDDLKTMNVRKSWTGVEVFSENTTGKEDSRRRMSISFINKIQSGTEPQEAATQAMREEVLHLIPDAINHPEGMEYIDDSGRIKKIMPNGDVVEIQSTKKDTRKKETK